jgi:hypothetical protein
MAVILDYSVSHHHTFLKRTHSLGYLAMGKMALKISMGYGKCFWSLDHVSNLLLLVVGVSDETIPRGNF